MNELNRWNLLMELDGMDSNAVLRQYTWGLDLAGQNGGAATSPDRQGVGGLHGAGGIGGLLAMRSGSGTSSTADDGSYLYFYNANGDIGQLMKTSNEGGGYGTTAARYEYYPFGGDLVSVFNPTSGNNPARNNPFRFSTKYRDTESKCYYYGYRYLRPKHGRWISRDPIGEFSFPNIMAFISNDPQNYVDLLGLIGLHDPPAPVRPVPQPWWKESPPSPTQMREYKELIALLKRQCLLCCKCIPNMNQCDKEAEKIGQALAWVWTTQQGRSGQNGGHLVGGYFCWDWEKGFFDAATSVGASQWGVEHGKFDHQNSRLVHYFIKLRTCGNDKPKCELRIDDGFFDGNKIHDTPWQIPPDWIEVPWQSPRPCSQAQPLGGFRYTYPPIKGCPACP